MSQTVETKEVTTQKVSNAPVQTEPPQKAYEKKKFIFRTYQIIWYILGVVEILLVFRLVLKALGANPTSEFTNLIYGLSDPLVFPFSGIFRTTVSPSYGAVFEWSIIIAIIVYAVIAFGLVQLLQLIKPTTPQEVENTVDTQ